MLTDLTDLMMLDFASNPCINAYSNDPEYIQELNIQLPIHCPPLTTTPDPPTTTLTSGVEIKCIYYNMIFGNPVGTKYTCDCEATMIISVDNPTTVTNISGGHNLGKRNEDVIGFMIYV